MGNNLLFDSSSPSHPQTLHFLKQVELQHFGIVSVYLDTSLNTQLFLKQYQFMYQGESKYKFLDNVKNINQNIPYLVKLLKIYELEENNSKQMCNRSNKICCLFEYHPTTLKMMIQSNKKKGLSFTEKQIIWFINCFLKACAHLNSNGNYHGDINPQFIYLNLKTHHLTLFDSVFFDTTNSGYYRASKGKSYLAPQILTNLAEKRSFPNFNPYKSDIYSIGMVILYCMTLIDPISAYDYGKFEIDGYCVENLLRIAGKKYSQGVVNTVRKMLVKGRGTSRELVEELISVGMIASDRDRSTKSDHTASTKG